MNKQNFDINQLRVAAPCSIGWETMTGDERIRHCQSCQLNVYNISAMTATEVENLITKREGRLCIRLYKRRDGTVLTKDCPIGFRAVQKRAARLAGATLAAILGLFSVSFGQKDAENSVNAAKTEITAATNQNRESVLKGIVTDLNGAVIQNAELKLFRNGEKEFLKTKTDAKGNYFFRNVSAGIYTLVVKMKGFTTHNIVELEIKSNQELKVNVELETGRREVIIGIFAEEPQIDSTSGSLTTRISPKQIQKLPF